MLITETFLAPQNETLNKAHWKVFKEFYFDDEGYEREKAKHRKLRKKRLDIEKMKKFISSVQATGGGDFPEDVVGGQRKCLD